MRAKAAPFLEELARVAGPGAALPAPGRQRRDADWNAGRSDINTLLVLREMDLAVLESIAPLGKRFKGTGIAPPLVMDHGVRRSSLDVFPMEFLEMRLIHETVLGEDLLAGDRRSTAATCASSASARSRAASSGCARGTCGSLGEPKALTETLVRFLAGYQPLARGILVLLGKEPPLRRAEAFAALAAAVGPGRRRLRRDARGEGGPGEAGRGGRARPLRALPQGHGAPRPDRR